MTNDTIHVPHGKRSSEGESKGWRRIGHAVNVLGIVILIYALISELSSPRPEPAHRVVIFVGGGLAILCLARLLWLLGAFVVASPSPKALGVVPYIQLPLSVALLVVHLSAPPNAPINITIAGLDRPSLNCSTLVFFKGQKESKRVPLKEASCEAREGRPRCHVTVSRGTADWLKFEGSTDGKCPWGSFSLYYQTDPNYIPLDRGEIVLQFGPKR